MLPAALLSKIGRSSATFSARPRIFWPWSGPRRLSYMRSNSNSGGTRVDEEVALSLADVVIEDEQEE